MTILGAWENWRRTNSLDVMLALPLLVIWGVWLARNNSIFADKGCTPEITANVVGGILTAFPQHIRVKNQREVLEVEINKTVFWGFFDGAAQENRCRGGAILFLLEGHFFELTMGLGEGSNNYAKMPSLKLLLIFAAEKGCITLKVFGDLMNVINWIKETQMWGNMRLSNILSSITDILDSYDAFPRRHVLRENNREVENALKEGLLLTLGQWKINE